MCLSAGFCPAFDREACLEIARRGVVCDVLSGVVSGVLRSAEEEKALPCRRVSGSVFLVRFGAAHRSCVGATPLSDVRIRMPALHTF